MIKQFLQGIGKFFSNLEKKQKITIIVALIVTIAFIVFLLVYNSGNKSYTGYSVLFDELDTKNSAAVVSILEKNQVQYVLKDESTILVPNADVYKQRLAVAEAGILKDNKVGFEIFDKQEFGATDEEQKIKFKRALEGELARTIESLEPIRKASVHIAFGKESLFVKEKQPPTASVVVNINIGMKLNQKQVIGIKNLVASSVANLSIENVKIIDQNGVTLGADENDFFDSDLLAAQVKYKKDYENTLEQKITNILAPILGGYDRVVARVNADFNFNQEQSQSEVFDPNSVARSESNLEEKKEGNRGKEVGGVPGAISNIGPVQGIQDGENKETYSKNQNTINYEISKKVTTIKGQFANLNRVSAAVVVDGKYDVDENGEIKYLAISEDELKKLQIMVQNAIGYNETRGDSVSVDNIRFNNIKTPVPPSVKISSFLEAYIMPFIPPAKYIFAMVLVFIFYKKVISPFVKKMLEDKVFSYEEEAELKKDDIYDDEEDSIEKFQQAKRKVEEQLGIDGGFDEDELQYEILLEKLRGICSERSDEVALLIQSLLKNDNEFNQSQKDM